jgi:hypothetical protein
MLCLEGLKFRLSYVWSLLLLLLGCRLSRILMKNDEMVKSILSKLVLSVDAVPNYKLQNEIMKYKDRIWVGCDSSIQKQIISALP